MSAPKFAIVVKREGKGSNSAKLSHGFNSTSHVKGVKYPCHCGQPTRVNATVWSKVERVILRERVCTAKHKFFTREVVVE